MNVNSGERIEVTVGRYNGPAGFTEADGKASLSFQSALPIPLGLPVTIKGRAWIVESSGPSKFLRGFKLVELRPAKDA